ncbi:Cytochrome b-c1 complex subunit 7 [Lamellibrachia satsuma]|nr:Cytochrome b-c1 complex subunit 7 [Lamellibrachia satsuma]
MAVRQAATPAWKLMLMKWAYRTSYFPQLGLLRDDTLEENELVKEAIRRLPDRVYDERMYRISRALNLSNQKTVLPKSEWAKFEDDVLYLQPYLEELRQEHKERALWNGQ